MPIPPSRAETRYRLHNEDCREGLRTYPDGFFSSCVTDPPYGLGFMGKGWDHGVPGVGFWEEVFRVLKPGAHLLAFGGTRTYHRMASAVEDSGFEIRDQIQWLYGSGFPKSLDVSKAIDKAAGAEREVVGEYRMPADSTAPGRAPSQGLGYGSSSDTAPATDDAKRWQGWGTALKPANEPIVVARKPLVGTVAANVLRHGTGAINVDACRVPTDGTEKLDGGRISTKTEGWDRPWKHDPEAIAACRDRGDAAVAKAEALGRWPANVIHDGSEEVLEAFARYGETSKPCGGAKKTASVGNNIANVGLVSSAGGNAAYVGDRGTAARFFYAAKAGRRERGEGNSHPTVKPLSLMRYLCRLVTPPGGWVLDPFAGSGTTGVGAAAEGFRFVGFENDTEHGYFDILQGRVADAYAR